MEVQFEPALQEKLDRIAHESGRAASDLVKDAVAGYVDELAETLQTLDSRYDDVKSGKVKLIPGDEVEAYFREKSAAARRSQASS
jgi:predicted transcriptional regulator